MSGLYTLRHLQVLLSDTTQRYLVKSFLEQSVYPLTADCSHTGLPTFIGNDSIATDFDSAHAVQSDLSCMAAQRCHRPTLAH